MSKGAVHIDLTEFRKWQKNLEASWQRFEDEFLLKFLLESADLVLRKTKPRTPVRTGDLRRGWALGKIIVYNNNLGVEITNNAWHDLETIFGKDKSHYYASHIEYGFTLPNGSYYPGRYMLTISLAEVRQSMPSRFDSAFKAWVKVHEI